MALIGSFRSLGTGNYQTQGTDKNYQVVLTCPKGEEDDYIPKPGTPDPEGDGYFIGANVERKATMSRITLNYTTKEPKPTIEIRKGDGDQEEQLETIWNLDINHVEEPIETHPNYLMKWKYELWYNTKKIKDKNPTPPSWFNTAKNANDADGESYLWSETKPGDNWKKFSGGRTKAGVESYYRAQVVITEEIKTPGYYSSMTYLETANIRKAPAKTFGYSSGNDYWLTQPGGITDNGETYSVINRYLYNPDKWDTDIYN